MVGRRGITILSDVVLMVALLMLISAVWLYSSEVFKSKKAVEAVSAGAAIHLYNAIEHAIGNPDSCLSMAISIPRGVRIYVADVSTQQGNATAIIVKEAGRRLDSGALARLLVVQGAPRSDVKIVYDNGRAVGAAVLINGTLVEGLPLHTANLDGDTLDLTGLNWSLAGSGAVVLTYKSTTVTVCSPWNNTLKAVALRISG